MCTNLDQRGAINRIVMLVASLILVAAALGIVAWRMSQDQIDPEIKQVLDNAECEFVDDADLCKFFASWDAAGEYTINATKNAAQSTTTFILEAESDAFRLEASEDESGETIAIGNTIYTLSEDGTWYEQTVEAEKVDEYRQDNNFGLTEPSSQEEVDAVSYTRGSTETCGERTCITYQVEGLSDKDEMRIWFDDQEYRLRRAIVTGDNGYSYDASVNYGEVSVEAPAQTTVLGENQTIPPGQTQPTQQGHVLPATGDQFDPEEYQKWLEQREP